MAIIDRAIETLTQNGALSASFAQDFWTDCTFSEANHRSVCCATKLKLRRFDAISSAGHDLNPPFAGCLDATDNRRITHSRFMQRPHQPVGIRGRDAR
jgi:hypothetical protein